MNPLPKRAHLGALFAAALALGSAAHAASGDGEALERARQELREARDELRRAAEQLARVAREQGLESPDAQAFAFMANPKRAMLGVGIAQGPEKDGVLRGVLVTAVTPGSGADKAGLKTGDLLLSANGRSLAARRNERPGPERKLRELMSDLAPGDEVRIEYEREGRTSTTTVVAQRPESLDLGWLLPQEDEDGNFTFRVPRPPLPPEPPHVRFEDGEGLQLARLDADLASYFKTREGVLVVKAPKDNPLGLKSGDVIREIDGRPVDSPVETMERLYDAGTKRELALSITRHGRGETLKGRWQAASGAGAARKQAEVSRDDDAR